MRRQARFYLWREASKFSAIIFYLFISIVLRYGPNKEYYNFSEDPYVPVKDSGGNTTPPPSFAVLLCCCGESFV